MAIRRLVAAGAQPITWLGMAGELQRDWAGTERLGEVAQILFDHAGIRAAQRGQQPRRARFVSASRCRYHPHRLRPSIRECFRLKWENSRDGLIDIHKGKGTGSRRRIPASRRVQGILEMRKGQSDSGWIFPAPTRSGHVEASSIKKQHAAAVDEGVHQFVLYTLRHTCLTRWGKTHGPVHASVLAATRT